VNQWPSSDLFCKIGAIPLAWPKEPPSGRSGPEPSPENTWQGFAASSQLVVQATSAGMRGAEAGDSVRDIVPWSRLDPTTLAYDLVYNPPITPFLEAARSAGLPWEGGLGMLVEQAALSIQLWLGLSPSRDVMREAAETLLAARALS
jgi:shikimate dehydrogenase